MRGGTWPLGWYLIFGGTAGIKLTPGGIKEIDLPDLDPNTEEVLLVIETIEHGHNSGRGNIKLAYSIHKTNRDLVCRRAFLFLSTEELACVRGTYRRIDLPTSWQFMSMP